MGKGWLLLGFVACDYSPKYEYCHGGSRVGIPLHVPTVPPGLNLLAHQLVTRHGARTPIKPIGVSNQWNCSTEEFAAFSQQSIPGNRSYKILRVPGQQALGGNCYLGQLTALGAQQHLSIGRGLRKALIEDLAFLSPKLNPEEIYVRSTEVNRVLMSAQSQLRGLYPTLSADEKGSFPIHVVEHAVDNLFPNDILCPAGAANYQEKKLLTHSISWREKMESLSEDIKVIEQTYGTKYDSAGPWLPDYADTFHVAECNNHTFPPAITRALRNRVYEAGDLWWTLRFRFGPFALMTIGPFLLEELHANFAAAVFRATNRSQAKFNVSPPNKRNRPVPLSQKFILYSGHDSTIAPLLSILGAPKFGWPPLAANLMFQLLQARAQPKDNSHHSSGFYVRVMYNGDVLQLSHCGPEPGGAAYAHHLCTWEQWLAKMKSVTAATRQAAVRCQLDYHDQLYGSGNAGCPSCRDIEVAMWRRGAIAAVVASVISWVFFFSYFSGCLQSRRTVKSSNSQSKGGRNNGGACPCIRGPGSN